MAVADVPARDILLGRLFGSMKSPIANLARVLDQIAEKGGAGACAPAAKEEEAQEAAPAVENTAPTQKPSVNVLQMSDLEKVKSGNYGGLSPDGVVNALTGIKSMVHDNPNACEYYDISQDTQKSLNKLVLTGLVATIAIEIVHGRTEFAYRMRGAQLEAIKEIAPQLGITLDEKLLPAAVPAESTVEVHSSAIKVSAETKKKIKSQDKSISAKAPLDPTKIETEDQLKDALVTILANGVIAKYYDRITKACNFYSAYLKCKAQKSENKEEELKKINTMSVGDLAQAIADFLGNCPFALEGMSRIMRNTVQETKSPISAFILFNHTTKNDTTGEFEDPHTVAEITKVMVIWSAKSCIADKENDIKLYEKNIKALGVDKKKNVAGIKAEEARIKKAKDDIAYCNNIINYVINPSYDIVDKITTPAFDDDKDPDYALIRRIFRNVVKFYYKDVDTAKMDKECLLKNVQQRAGIIINLFRDPLAQNIAYSESNITDLIPAKEDAEKKEEKADEKPAKK